MTNKGLGPKVKKLHEDGYTALEICQKLNCSRANVYYYTGNGYRERVTLHKRLSRLKMHPFSIKLITYRNCKITKYKNQSINKTSNYILLKTKIKSYSVIRKGRTLMKNMKPEFTPDDVINKFKDKQICYLTGDSIDIYQPRTYHFDHVMPVSRGGDNSLENLELATKQANQAKGNMTPDEFLYFCKKVLLHHGYKVTLEEVESSSSLS